MKSNLSSLLATLMLILIPTAGCKAVDEPGFGFMASLSGDQGEADADIATPVNLESGDGESVTLASMQTANREAIRTLKDGEDLQEIVDSASGVVLLDFYADWCGPCRKQSSELHEVEDFALEVNAQIIKVNVDEHRGLAKKYQVSSLPTLLAVKDGEVLQRKLGFTKRDQVKSMLH